MFQYVALIIFFVAICVTYRILSNSIKHTTKDAVRSKEMLMITSTNNNYPPLGDVLSNLDDDLNELGLSLSADMKGYMNDAKKS